jgi:hypothetical protein
MKHKTLRFGEGFGVVLGNRRSQAAQMVLAPGNRRATRATATTAPTSGSSSSREAASPINGKRYPLRPGSLFLIERGDRHEIRNTGRARLTTLNFYVPPGYKPNGDECRPASPRN